MFVVLLISALDAANDFRADDAVASLALKPDAEQQPAWDLDFPLAGCLDVGSGIVERMAQGPRNGGLKIGGRVSDRVVMCPRCRYRTPVREGEGKVIQVANRGVRLCE